ncbi:transporter [Salmonella enterica subsp. enterica serovar Choleraesuis]|nr:transporter [Salmonella enterica subsp. enterica serovar Choleraesuis]
MKTASKGWGSGLAGVIIFSGSLPATRLAIADFSPIFLTAARGALAAVLALILLAIWRQPLPRRRDILPLVAVAFGVVIGFPLLSALALESISAGRSLIFIGLLPLATAAFGVLRAKERLPWAFWLFALAGAACVAGFALIHSSAGDLQGDAAMVAAVILCGAGYAEGAILTRRLGGWQVISWALLLAFPALAAIALFTVPGSFNTVTPGGWLSLGYVSVFSMLLGFVFWYRGLALGGIASIGQLQLLQPFFGLLLAAGILHEPVGSSLLITAFLVAGCVVAARRSAQPLRK